MDRLNKIKDRLIPFCSVWTENKVKMCRKQPEMSLLEQAERVLQKVKDDQEQGSERVLCYLSLFHFKSSLWTGTNRYQICASDETLYLNPPLASADWVPEYLYNDMAILQTAVETELRKYFVRLLSYEINFAVRLLLEEYQKIAGVYWQQAAEQLVTGSSFKTIQKHDSWKVISGPYMDHMKIVLQSENRR